MRCARWHRGSRPPRTAGTRSRGRAARRAGRRSRGSRRDAAAGSICAGLRSASTNQAHAAGSARIATTARVHVHAPPSTVQPSSSRSVSATGTTLRRRLSSSFHCDSNDRGFASRRSAGPAPSAAASRRAASRRGSSDGGGSRRRRSWKALFAKRHVGEQARAGVAAFQQVVAQDAVAGKRSAIARSNASTS
jgi:hypothetical protein